MGRKSDYCQATVDRVCNEIAAGNSLRAICADPDMPCVDSIITWLGKHPSFAAQYAQARATQAEGYADEIVEIADSVRAGTAEQVAAARLAVDSRKWIAAKLLPKKYGERLDVEHGGEVTHRHMTLAQFEERVTEAKRLSGRVVEGGELEQGESGK